MSSTPRGRNRIKHHREASDSASKPAEVPVAEKAEAAKGKDKKEGGGKGKGGSTAAVVDESAAPDGTGDSEGAGDLRDVSFDPYAPP